MISPEAAPGDLELRSDLVLELIAPENSDCPLGRDDKHSEDLYGPMIKRRSAERMGKFINFSEQFINKSDPEDGTNAGKINRILALVCDMPDSPTELPDEERLRIWDHLWSADWIHWYGQTKDHSGIIRERVRIKQPGFATSVYGTLEHVIGRKDFEIHRIDDNPEDFVNPEMHKRVLSQSLNSLRYILQRW